MITIKIDNDEKTIEDQAIYLEYVAGAVRQGFQSGPGWDLTGEPEGEEE